MKPCGDLRNKQAPAVRRCGSNLPRSGKAVRILSDHVAGTFDKHHLAMSSQAIAYHRTTSKRERSIAFYKPRPEGTRNAGG